MLTKKPNLDEVTLRIARRMLSTPPKPHDEMKIGGGRRAKQKARKRQTKVATPSR